MDNIASRKGEATRGAADSVVDDYYNLRTHLNKLIESLQESNRMTPELSLTANAAYKSLDGIGGFISDKVDPVPFNERRKPDSTIARETFRSPELCEMTLEHCSFREIVRMSRTCRGVREIIEQSPALRFPLFAIPRPATAPASPIFKSPFNWDGDQYIFRDVKVTFSVEPTKHSAKSWIVSFEYTSTDEKLPRIDAKWSDLFICQPEFNEVVVLYTCGDAHAISESGTRILPAFTLSKLYEDGKRDLDDYCDRCEDEAYERVNRGKTKWEDKIPMRDMDRMCPTMVSYQSVEAYAEKLA